MCVNGKEYKHKFTIYINITKIQTFLLTFTHTLINNKLCKNVLV